MHPLLVHKTSMNSYYCFLYVICYTLMDVFTNNFMYLTYALTNVYVLWVQWSSNRVAQNQDILKHTEEQWYYKCQFMILYQTNSPVLLFCALPLHDSQTLTRHPPVWKQNRKPVRNTDSSFYVQYFYCISVFYWVEQELVQFISCLTYTYTYLLCLLDCNYFKNGTQFKI